jgi:hypothetical protein
MSESVTGSAIRSNYDAGYGFPRGESRGMPIDVRPYATSDLSAVEHITLSAYGHGVSPGMRSRLAIGAQHALFADRDGEAAGFVMGDIDLLSIGGDRYSPA